MLTWYTFTRHVSFNIHIFQKQRQIRDSKNIKSNNHVKNNN